MYDIHCHIIHGVDDGSDAIAESVEMLRMAYEGGTKAIVATPHCNIPDGFKNYWGTELENKFGELKKALADENIPIELYKGQEIFCSGDFAELLRAGELITINNSRYPLVEFRFNEHPDSVYRKLERLVAEGYVPVVAHPERYRFVAEMPDAAEKLKQIGCLLQINKGSLMGKFGESVKGVAHGILARRLATAVASDSHGPFVRTPYLADVHEYISARYSRAYADLLLVNNPKAILNDLTID